MSQLIALIIAIALGAIVTAIGYVFLGDAFTNNSAKATAQQLMNQASQMEMAFMAYKATNGTSPFDLDYNVVSNTLINDKFLKSELTSPVSDNFSMAMHNTDIFMLVLTSTELSQEVCDEINNYKNGTTAQVSHGGFPMVYLGILDTNGDTDKFGCFENLDVSGQYVFGYQVE